MITPERQLEVAVHLVKKCQVTKFWGDLVFSFRDGEITMTTARETKTPEKVASEINDISLED